MGITNLWPLIGLVLVPAIILLYILKKKYKEEEISSLLLWQEVYKNTQADTPWEKLKINIMMIIQIVIIILLIFALMNPFVNFKGKEYKNLIVVIDNTASMSAMYENNKTRLMVAKDILKDYMKNENYNINRTIIEYDGNMNFEIVGDIKDIKQKYGAGHISEMYSYVNSISRSYEDYEILVISDKNIDLGKIKGKAICLGNSGINAGIINISHKFLDNELQVIATIKNTGEKIYEGDFSLYDKTQLLEARYVSLKSGEIVTFNYTFKNIAGEYLKGELSKKDSIEGDNVFYDIIKQNSEKKILLVSSQNIFLEKGLKSIENGQIYKTSSLNNITDDSYDLYIFDNITPQIIPEKGNILFINPENNIFFNVENINKTVEASGTDNILSKYTSNMKFTVSEYKRLDVPYYAKPIIKSNEDTLGFIGENNGRTIAALGFDIHNSDIALKKEFPILIYELGSKLTQSGMLLKNNYMAGDNITINGGAETEEIQITTPCEYKQKLANSLMVREIEELGIYGVKEKTSDGEVLQDKFSINFPTAESDLKGEIVTENNNIKEKTSILTLGLSIVPLILILALIGIVLEYVLYLRGN